MASAQKIVVKLTNPTDVDGGPGLIRTILGSRAVRQVEPLFPRDAEPDMATLFDVTLADTASPSESVATLTRDARVQYAHETRTRSFQ